MSDNFGDRMKFYERIETSRRFTPLLPIYARIDGRSFSKFTKGMNRPYDVRLSRIMIETTKYLVKETHALIGYTESDEISLGWYSDSFDSQIFFDGKIQKMVSVLAGMASSRFVVEFIKEFGMDELEKRATPAFDCRVFALPNKVELANAFLWRELDATKNAISMAARAHFSHKELMNKNGADMQEMMWQAGTNFNDYPAFFKRGTFVRRSLVEVELGAAELAAIPEKHRPSVSTVLRTRMVEVDMPQFSKVINRVGVVFDGEDPLILDKEESIAIESDFNYEMKLASD